MEALKVAQEILNLISDLRRLCSDLESLSIDRAQSMADYDKAIMIRILELKADGIQTTLCKDIAKGDCCEELRVKENCMSMYKIKNTKIECATASLIGLQSINKHLSEV